MSYTNKEPSSSDNIKGVLNVRNLGFLIILAFKYDKALWKRKRWSEIRSWICLYIYAFFHRMFTL